MRNQSGGAGAAVLLLALAVAVGAASALAFVQSTQGVVSGPALQAALDQCAWCVAVFAGGPVLLGIVAALVANTGASGTSEPAATADREPAAPAPPPTDAALRLLALFQQEGRLVDFLLEEIAGYEDAQIGAAVRGIHAGCRAVLQERLELERILEGEDGDPVDVPAGFDAGAIRVTGNVAGAPPFKGTLQHSGWRAVKVMLPESSTDPRIVAPAEVEVS